MAWNTHLNLLSSFPGPPQLPPLPGRLRPPGGSEATATEAPAVIGLWLILGGCVALVWWAVRKRQRQGRQEYSVHSTTSGADRPATDRQLGYIESLLDSAGISLNDATRSALGRSVSMDRLLPIDEASDLIDYLKEHPGDLQGAATHRRHPANRGPNAAPVLRPLLNRPDVLVIDVETTGLG